MQDQGFTEAQKQYLEGFFAAIAGKRGNSVPAPAPSGADPTAIHREAQERAVAAGGQLSPEELAKREKDPFDIWDEMLANAAAGRFPKGLDVFRHKFHGLFYVGPNQDAFMLRLRLPGGILQSAKAFGIADIAERFGGGYVDLTTRANLQIREIGAAHPVAVLEAVQELGLSSRGSGADNIRNLTGSPTAGIDPQELYDTRPLSRDLYHYILNHRELYGLPRKFNIAFDGGGRVAMLADTADIGFCAVRVRPASSLPPGVCFRMLLGGLTGHQALARDSGVLLQPQEVLPAAVAILRLFIAQGDRTDRKRARLHYLLARRGIETCLADAAAHLPFAWRFAPPEACEPRGEVDRQAHVGVQPQAQPGLCYVGVVVPAGRLSSAQLRGLAGIAEGFGSGTLRLTIWQNLLVSDIPREQLPAALAAIAGLGLGTEAGGVRGNIIACTGSAGCKFALADTKRHALALADHLGARLALDMPVNIHLTGCPNSCAQHYVGDIGLLATRVERDGEDEVEGYHIVVGGDSGAVARLGRELCSSVPAAQLPERIEAMLHGYLAGRRLGESFRDFVNRHEIGELIRLFERTGG